MPTCFLPKLTNILTIKNHFFKGYTNYVTEAAVMNSIP